MILSSGPSLQMKAMFLEAFYQSPGVTAIIYELESTDTNCLQRTIGILFPECCIRTFTDSIVKPTILGHAG